MTQTLGAPWASTVSQPYHRHPFGLFKELERPGDVFRDLGPNWFAAVMGTGIVAIAGAVLPLPVPGLRVFATAVWALAGSLPFCQYLVSERALSSLWPHIVGGYLSARCLIS